jgi:hypothetical protein
MAKKSTPAKRYGNLKRLPPLFSYYGSKWLTVPKYPAPHHEIVIEPFAGSAQYALYYPNHDVRLYDLDENIVMVWDYIIHAPSKEILNLDLDFHKMDVSKYTEEQRLLIGFWVSAAAATPKQTWTKLGRKKAQTIDWRKRVAHAQPYLRHWTIEHKSYNQIPNMYATWFVDPPYEEKGAFYRRSSKDINYQHLGEWCLGRRGSIIVCENQGAQWLPFQFLLTGRSARVHKGISSKEVIYTDICDDLHVYVPPPMKRTRRKKRRT